MDYQNHLKHVEERPDQDEQDAHENWLISEEIQEMVKLEYSVPKSQIII